MLAVAVETDDEKRRRLAQRINDLVAEFERLGVKSRDDIAHSIGVSRHLLWRQGSNITKPDEPVVIALEQRLAELRRRLAAQGDLPENEPIPASVPLPVLGVVNAGHLITEEEQDLGTVTVERELVPRGRGYVVRVAGESMAPDYRDGDLVVVNRDAEPTVRDDVIVNVPGGGTVLRRVVMHRGKERLEAVAKGYEPLPFGDEEIERQGVVVGVLGRSRR